MLRMWVEVNEAGGAVGFLPGAELALRLRRVDGGGLDLARPSTVPARLSRSSRSARRPAGAESGELPGEFVDLVLGQIRDERV